MLYFQTWKTLLILGVCLLGVVFASPNVIPQDMRENLPSFMSNSLKLGLDLQGGQHLLLQVEVSEIFEQRLENLEDQVRTTLLSNNVGYTGLGVVDQELRVRVRDVAQLSLAEQAISDLAEPVSGGTIGFGAAGGDNILVSSTPDGLITVVLTEEAQTAITTQAVAQSIEVVRRRVDAFGTTEPTIQRQGRDRIIVQVPGGAIDSAVLNTTARLEFRMHDNTVPISQALEGRVPSRSEVLATTNPAEPYLLVRNAVLIDGDSLVNAQPGFSQRTGEPIVSIRFDTQGAQRFSRITRDNVGYRFAVVLDGVVITAPNINEHIPSGSAEISGSFTPETANNLATLLRAGALPASLTIIEERNVGAELGQDSIHAGQYASLIGFALVIVFMIAAYGLFGVFADIALIVNMILIAGALSLFQATLTLPGIAGIILTIGMAVDANVLIFERIREEIAAGKTPINAVETGYSRALGTILDANITTLIAAVILFQFGAGPIRGFAVTLGIGIITSVFTAFTFTRFIVATWLRTTRPKRLPI